MNTKQAAFSMIAHAAAHAAKLAASRAEGAYRRAAIDHGQSAEAEAYGADHQGVSAETSGLIVEYAERAIDRAGLGETVAEIFARHMTAMLEEIESLTPTGNRPDGANDEGEDDDPGADCPTGPKLAEILPSPDGRPRDALVTHYGDKLARWSEAGIETRAPGFAKHLLACWFVESQIAKGASEVEALAERARLVYTGDLQHASVGMYTETQRIDAMQVYVEICEGDVECAAEALGDRFGVKIARHARAEWEAREARDMDARESGYSLEDDECGMGELWALCVRVAGLKAAKRACMSWVFDDEQKGWLMRLM